MLYSIHKTYFEIDGQGDDVLCIHGLGGSTNTFSSMMTAWKNKRVIRVELPGSARSAGSHFPINIDGFIQFIQAVCTEYKVYKADLVGHSLGTIVAQHVAVQMPKLVKSLTLLGPLMTPSDTAKKALQLRADKLNAEGVVGMYEVAETLLNSAIASHHRENKSLVYSYVRESLMQQPPLAYAKTCLALAAASPPEVAKIPCQTVLVTGEMDLVAPPQSVYAMAQRYTSAKNIYCRVVSKCAHWTPIEAPEECVQAHLELLR
ncbi:MAG: alpha/beta hydrolase [Gammaproteobacteria bacterium]|nr:alpha/beta hydrolase [Gammaproteobacteria bacterium]